MPQRSAAPRQLGLQGLYERNQNPRPNLRLHYYRDAHTSPLSLMARVLLSGNVQSQLLFPEETAPTYLLRDRDAIYGDVFARRVKGLGMREILIAPRAPWQNPFAERVIGSIRRECFDHVIVINERHLRRLLRSHVAYYAATRPHQALHNNSPYPRDVQTPTAERIVAIPQVGGLHHRYQRVA